jgi:hypothetical protein
MCIVSKTKGMWPDAEVLRESLTQRDSYGCETQCVFMTKEFTCASPFVVAER